MHKIRYIELDTKRKKFKPLVNSVSVMEDGFIIVCDGANCLTEKIDSNGVVVAAFGGSAGAGSHSLKEPVGAFVCHDSIIVADWHNHRLVVLDLGLRYLSEYGSKGDVTGGGSPKRLLLSLRMLFYHGSYIDAHFMGEATQIARRRKSGYSISAFLASFSGLLISPKSLQNLWSSIKDVRRALDKPNGACQLSDRLLVTQKNNQCVSIYALRRGNLQFVGHKFNSLVGEQFGRLGQCFALGGKFYVCDPEKAVVWVLNEKGDCEAKISASDFGIASSRWFPFSGCSVRGGVAAFGGREHVHIVDIKRYEVLCTHKIEGEVHGVDFCGKSGVIYVADRLNGRLVSIPSLWTQGEAVLSART